MYVHECEREGGEERILEGICMHADDNDDDDDALKKTLECRSETFLDYENVCMEITLCERGLF